MQEAMLFICPEHVSAKKFRFYSQLYTKYLDCSLRISQKTKICKNFRFGREYDQSVVHIFTPDQRVVSQRKSNPLFDKFCLWNIENKGILFFNFQQHQLSFQHLYFSTFTSAMTIRNLHCSLTNKNVVNFFKNFLFV